MPDIAFDCPACGQSLEAPEEMAGTEIECPTCGEVLALPGFEEEVAVCPKCDAELDPDAVLCVACGYHLELGKVLKTEM